MNLDSDCRSLLFETLFGLPAAQNVVNLVVHVALHEAHLYIAEVQLIAGGSVGARP